MRILGIDYGDRRIGVAVSDPLMITTKGLDTISYTTEDDIISKFIKIIDEYKIEKIIIGNPIKLNGQEDIQSEKVKLFANTLKNALKNSIEIILWDERLTSQEAHKFMIHASKKIKTEKKLINELSARIILQSYLDSL
jgi:putative Holliday junction resolvase